ncbi:hypothetical protein CA51_32740 [Rosistilla oblonga]|uniref:MotA/TolQ/ExbB proton channel family protein n=1 Tax=Rosistilla oblonga TaxID=2527990 RepID=UPI00118A35B7|nr:MotA/TolQ/ExbB proton channel family protein [Rosistilla oblonga]QDV13384.1 hypothetical protein CA51_32740 [Rosistilla oblonga]
MSFFKIPCPKCNKSLKVSIDLAGKSRACPYCRATVRIPDAEPMEAAETASGFPNINLGEKPAAAKPAAAATPPSLPNVSTAPVAAAAAAPAGKKRHVKAKRPQKSWFSAGNGEAASSDVSLVISGLIGAVATVIWLGLMYPLRQFQFGQLFWDRGPVPFPTTLLMFWALAILFLKWLNLKKQKDAMLLDVLPVEISNEITIDSLDRFIMNINELPGASSDTFLVNRVVRGIEHFRVRKSAAETVTMMESQSAIDANNVAGSYTILKVFIWSLPILGFIGTVMGVSAAVASLATSLSGGGNMDAMKAALQDVFGGLGTAFDTTLLALIMSMLVKLPASALQKSEEDLISNVDEYCNENLLRRLNDGREGGAERGVGGASSGGDVAIFRAAVEQALGTQHAEMERWLKKLDAIGTSLTSQVSKGWDEVNGRIEQQQQQHVAMLQKQTLDQQAVLQAQLDQMANAAEKIQGTLANLADQAASMNTNVSGTFAHSQNTMQEHLAGLDRGLSSLSGVLEKLGDQQVVVQQVETRRSGWFGGGSKKASRNGRR